MPSLLFHNTYLEAPSLIIAVLFVTLVTAALYDLKTLTIPHVFTYIFAGLFVLAAVLSGLSLSAWVIHLIACTLALFIGIILFILGMMGGGDVKFFAAIGLWVAPLGLLGLVFCITVSGTIISLLYLLINMSKAVSVKTDPMSMSDRLGQAKTAKIPYGPALAIGTIAHYTLSALITAV